MTLWNPRERFSRLLRRPDARIDLAEAALLIAAEEYPRLDVSEYLGRLDALAEQARPRLAGLGSPRDRAAGLIAFLFGERGFVGNELEYDDPRNSFLNDVLDRGTGIPISLSLVYMEVGRRIGLRTAGVGFPGHFLVRLEGASDALIDPFFGRIVGREGCQELLGRLFGPEVRLEPEHLREVTPREFLVRMLSNLKHLYVRRSDFGRALSCCERILLVEPDAPLELRDRGVVYERLECYAAAAADYQRFLELAPDDESTGLVRERLGRMQGRLRLH